MRKMRTPIDSFDSKFENIVNRFTGELRTALQEQVVATLRESVGRLNLNGMSVSNVVATRSASTKERPPSIEVRPVATAARRPRAFVAVSCPVEGCKKEGKRRLSNFCIDHSRTLKKGERDRLRKAQIKARKNGVAEKKTSASSSAVVKSTMPASATKPASSRAKKVSKSTKKAPTPTEKKAKKGAPSAAPKPPVVEAEQTSGTKQIQCPIYGCTTPGVAEQQDFCTKHFESVSESDRTRFYELKQSKQASK